MNLNLTFGKKSGQVGGGRPVFDQRQRQTRVADGALISNPPAKGGIIFMGDIAEFDESAHTCKHMKVFELAVDLLATDTTVYFKRGNFNHVLEAGLNIMVAPTAVDGTGVGILVGTVTATTHETAGEVYAFDITAADFSASTIEAGTLFVEAAEAGADVAMLVTNPNTCFTHDIYIDETPATGGDWSTGFTYAASLFNSATLIECMATPVPAGVKENLRKGYSDIRVINYV